MFNQEIPSLTITEPELREFENAFPIAHDRIRWDFVLELERLKKGTKPIAISFDKDWKPFLDETKGYHSDPNDRCYFETTPLLLQRVKTACVSLRDWERWEKTGCRVHITSRGATLARTREDILRWTPAREFDWGTILLRLFMNKPEILSQLKRNSNSP